jgi:hypothetical protein
MDHPSEINGSTVDGACFGTSFAKNGLGDQTKKSFDVDLNLGMSKKTRVNLRIAQNSRKRDATAMLVVIDVSICGTNQFSFMEKAGVVLVDLSRLTIIGFA